jgi:hypothetical protein
MRLRHCLLATTLIAGTVTAAAAQDPNPELRPERRPWIRIEPNDRRPLSDFYRFRVGTDRRRIVERALERAEQIRARARDRSLDRLDSMRDREFAMRDRLTDRLNASLRRERVTGERAMERVRERLDRLRDDHRYLIRRRARTI